MEEFDYKTYAEIDDYLSNQWDDSLRVQFEKRMNDNPLLKKEVELHRSLKNAINQKDWELTTPEMYHTNTLKTAIQLTKNEEHAQLFSQVNKVHNSYFKKQSKEVLSLNKKNVLYLISTIAAIGLLLITWIYNQPISSEKLYAQYANDWKDLPSFITQNDETQSLLMNAERLFINKQYKEAEAAFSNLLNSNSSEVQAQALIYLGVLYIELEKYSDALSTFSKLSTSDTLFKYRMHWYKSLLYLKQNKKVEAKKELQLLLSNPKNYKYTTAKKLFDAL